MDIVQTMTMVLTSTETGHVTLICTYLCTQIVYLQVSVSLHHHISRHLQLPEDYIQYGCDTGHIRAFDSTWAKINTVPFPSNSPRFAGSAVQHQLISLALYTITVLVPLYLSLSPT